MDSEQAHADGGSGPEETQRRLASEMTEVESAIALVTSGSVTRVTLSGLRFGEQVARQLQAGARLQGLCLERTLWPEDAGCDLVVRRLDG